VSGLSNFLSNVYGEDDDANAVASVTSQDQRATPNLDDVRDSMEALVADTEASLGGEPFIPETATVAPQQTLAETLETSDPADDWFSEIDDHAVRVPTSPAGGTPTSSANLPEFQMPNFGADNPSGGQDTPGSHFLDEINEADSTDWFDVIEDAPTPAPEAAEHIAPAESVTIESLVESTEDTSSKNSTSEMPPSLPAFELLQEPPTLAAPSFKAPPAAPDELLSDDDFGLPESPEFEVDPAQPWIDEILSGPEEPAIDRQRKTEVDFPAPTLDPVLDLPAPETDAIFDELPPPSAESILASPIQSGATGFNTAGPGGVDGQEGGAPRDHGPSRKAPAVPLALDPAGLSDRSTNESTEHAQSTTSSPQSMPSGLPAPPFWTSGADDIIPGKDMGTSSISVEAFSPDPQGTYDMPSAAANRRSPQRGRRDRDDPSNESTPDKGKEQRRSRKRRFSDAEVAADLNHGFPPPADIKASNDLDLPTFDGFDQEFAPPAPHELPLGLAAPSMGPTEMAPPADTSSNDEFGMPALDIVAELFDPPAPDTAPQFIAAPSVFDMPVPDMAAPLFDAPAPNMPPPPVFDAPAPGMAAPSIFDAPAPVAMPAAPISDMAQGLADYGDVLDQGPAELDPALSEEPKRRRSLRRRS
jgi:hypothetical protein